MLLYFLLLLYLARRSARYNYMQKLRNTAKFIISTIDYWLRIWENCNFSTRIRKYWFNNEIKPLLTCISIISFAPSILGSYYIFTIFFYLHLMNSACCFDIIVLQNDFTFIMIEFLQFSTKAFISFAVIFVGLVALDYHEQIGTLSVITLNDMNKLMKKTFSHSLMLTLRVSTKFVFYHVHIFRWI